MRTNFASTSIDFTSVLRDDYAFLYMHIIFMSVKVDVHYVSATSRCTVIPTIVLSK